MEDTFLTFSRSLPAATLLMLLVLLLSRSKISAVRRHQWLGWGLGLACLIPFIEPHLPQWRILPRVEGWTMPTSVDTSWFLLLAAAWLLGSTIMMTRIVTGVLLLHWHQRATIPVDDEDMLSMIQRCQARTGLSHAPEVFLQPSYPMPMTWGWRRARIWLPLSAEDWSEEELECVLLHEMAHIERQDFPAEILNRISLAMYWFHPMAWMLARRMELAREMACDDQVLLIGKRASHYAESLAHIGADLPVALPTTAAGFLGRKPLLARMMGIADPWQMHSRLTREDVWSAAAPLSMVALFVCSLGFKAVAEIHADQSPFRASIRTPVVSVWDDVIGPVVELAEAQELSSAPKQLQPTWRTVRTAERSIATAPSPGLAPLRLRAIGKSQQMAKLELPSDRFSLPMLSPPSSRNAVNRQAPLVGFGRTVVRRSPPPAAKMPTQDSSATTTTDTPETKNSDSPPGKLEAKETQAKIPTEKKAKITPSPDAEIR
ncbi:MAG: M56 family metallopeptidase [Limisphaerales bacterium]